MYAQIFQFFTELFTNYKFQQANPSSLAHSATIFDIKAYVYQAALMVFKMLSCKLMHQLGLIVAKSIHLQLR